MLLSLVGVRLTILDKDGRDKGPASGFLRHQDGRLWLYTCWHVVSGYDPNDLLVKDPPSRRRLRVTLQVGQEQPPGIQGYGGTQDFTVDLYDGDGQPAWQQDNAHIPHPDLNAIGIHVPFWHDVVRLPVPDGIATQEMQIIGPDRTLSSRNGLLVPGDECMVVGFPYGYSAGGTAKPVPVALTRFVASTSVPGRRRELLLESSGTVGMSGAPVFVRREENLLLFGVYTGAIYPDFQEGREKATSLGTVCNASFLLCGDMVMVDRPREAQARPAT